jgi:hypothetical protein
MDLHPDHFSAEPTAGKRTYNPEALFLPNLDAVAMWQTILREWVGFAAYWVVGYI